MRWGGGEGESEGGRESKRGGDGENEIDHARKVYKFRHM